MSKKSAPAAGTAAGIAPPPPFARAAAPKKVLPASQSGLVNNTPAAPAKKPIVKAVSTAGRGNVAAVNKAAAKKAAKPEVRTQNVVKSAKDGQFVSPKKVAKSPALKDKTYTTKVKIPVDPTPKKAAPAKKAAAPVKKAAAPAKKAVAKKAPAKKTATKK